MTRPRPGVAATAAVLALLIGVILIALLVRRTILAPASKAIQGSGIAATATRTVPRFHAVDLAGGNNITIAIGDRQSILVHGDDNLIRYVTTRVIAGTLVISNTRSYAARTAMRVTITTPSLRLVRLSGSGTVHARHLASLQIVISLPGSGIVRADGRATRLSVTLGGSGQAELFGLVAQDVHAAIAGSGEIRVTATRSLHATIPGSGQILYKGEPAHVLKSVTGSGAITRSA